MRERKNIENLTCQPCNPFTSLFGYPKVHFIAVFGFRTVRPGLFCFNFYSDSSKNEPTTLGSLPLVNKSNSTKYSARQRMIPIIYTYIIYQLMTKSSQRLKCVVADLSEREESYSEINLRHSKNRGFHAIH